MGPELILGRLFDDIGFNMIPEQLFGNMIVARRVCPTSRLKTIDYLYRFLDRLNQWYSKLGKEIAYGHRNKVLKRIAVVS
ncbi:MAG: hypothetical protein GKR87_14015 [Kiritimatiellae bacterium]|nr:hypothetical protein [Kiritimatiellia bacterium]